MKNIILALTLIIMTLTAKASVPEIVDLSIDVQEQNSKSENFRLKLPLGTETSLSKTTENKEEKVTVTTIKWKDNLYKVNLKVEKAGQVLNNSEVMVQVDQEAIIQNFDSEGNSDLKIIIKANR